MQTKKKQKSDKKPFAKKSFGQNFLVDENYVNKIISALELNEKDSVIEIGAGRGALTEKLIESGANLAAIELEKDMIEILRERFSEKKNFHLIESDALKIDFEEIRQTIFAGEKIKLVANLPYYISTAILQRLIEQRAVFSQMVLMFQREVVERITASAGSAERGFLTVLAENYLEIQRLFDVPPTAFRPVPKVWSAVVLLKPKSDSSIKNEELFRRIVSNSFLQKRKTILNNLKNSSFGREIDYEKLLQNADVEPMRRAETLSVEEWRKLYFELEKKEKG